MINFKHTQNEQNRLAQKQIKFDIWYWFTIYGIESVLNFVGAKEAYVEEQIIFWQTNKLKKRMNVHH